MLQLVFVVLWLFSIMLFQICCVVTCFRSVVLISKCCSLFRLCCGDIVVSVNKWEKTNLLYLYEKKNSDILLSIEYECVILLVT